MELVIVNGGNAIARGVMGKLAGKSYQKLKMLDHRPYRYSIYSFQKTLPPGVEFSKNMV